MLIRKIAAKAESSRESPRRSLLLKSGCSSNLEARTRNAYMRGESSGRGEVRADTAGINFYKSFPDPSAPSSTKRLTSIRQRLRKKRRISISSRCEEDDD